MAAKTASILARGYYKTRRAKTAHGLIRYGHRYCVLEVIDETCKGEDAGLYLYGKPVGIPIVEDMGEESEVLIIGIAPPGGALPEVWRRDIIRAIKMGKDIISGLHTYLSDDAEIAALASEHGVEIWDVRRPPEHMNIATGKTHTIPVILTAGTDSSLGKKTTAIEIYNGLNQRGINAAFIATGQTGLMIGCDFGCVVDAVKSDFVSGIVEGMVVGAERDGFDVAVVEGQGALSHVAYGPVAMGILYGSRPDAVVMVHDPLRKTRAAFNNEIVPDVGEEFRILKHLYPSANLAAVSLVTPNMQVEEYEDYKRRYHAHFNVPVADVLRDREGLSHMLERIMEILNLG